MIDYNPFAVLPKVGARVGAISHPHQDIYHLYGYGTYIGMYVPIESDPDCPVNLPGMSLVRSRLPHPRIKLDNGTYVWGCECYWGVESEVKKFLRRKSKRIVIKSIREVRAEYCRASISHLN
jgi:hypothetical protein